MGPVGVGNVCVYANYPHPYRPNLIGKVLNRAVIFEWLL